jgi:hypothetical protein
MSLFSFFNEMDSLIEMLATSLKSGTIMNDDLFILDAEGDSLIDVVFFSSINTDLTLISAQSYQRV